MPHSTTLDYTIRLFARRLRLVPPAERELASAHVDAEVRKAGGGVRRLTLASWTGAQPVPAFFKAVRQAWRSLPKEHDDDRRVVADEIDST
jgi:hypothetical protein